MRLFSREPEKKRKRFIVGFITSYYFILIIPFILVIVTFNTAANVIVRQSDDAVIRSLDQASSLTDANLRSMESVTLTLKQDENVQNFYQDWLKNSSTTFGAYKINHDLPQYTLVNSMIDKVAVYYGRNGESPCCFIMTNNSAMLYNENLLHFSFDATALSYRQLYPFLYNNVRYENYVAFPAANGDQPELYYVSKLNSSFKKEYSAYILIHLSDEYMKTLLSSAMYEEEGLAFVINEQGDLLYSHNSSDADPAFIDQIITEVLSSEDTHFLYEDYQVNLVRSSYNGWIYCSMIPREIVLHDLYEVRTTVVTISIIFFIVSLILCSFLTTRNSKPLIHILKTLMDAYPEPETFDNSADFRFLEAAVSDLIEKNNTLSEHEAHRTRLYNHQVLSRLFLGGDLNSETFQHDLKHSSLDLNHKTLLAAYLHIHRSTSDPVNYDTMTIPSMIQQANEVTGTEFYGYSIDLDNYVFLIAFPESSSLEQVPSILDQLNTLGEESDRRFHRHLDFYVSEPFQDYNLCSHAYIQCKELALHAPKEQSRYVYTLEDSIENEHIIHYSINQEIRLAQLIRYGSVDKLEELLEEIRYQNYEIGRLSETSQRALFNLIQNSIYRVFSDNEQDEHLQELTASIGDCNNYTDLVECLRQFQTAMHEHLHHDRNVSNMDELHGRILDYINQNYRNSNLNQAFLCEAMGINESIVTHMFRELGSSFHIYLENVRIDAACSLLQNKNMTVKMVAEQVGYTSDVSFRRAFKRVLGVSPSDFTKGSQPGTQNES